MLTESHAHELAQIAKKIGAVVLRGQFEHPGLTTGRAKAPAVLDPRGTNEFAPSS